MAERPATNASPLIFLSRAGLVDFLQLEGNQIVVPKPVAEEIQRRGSDDPTVQAIEKTNWLCVVEPPPKGQSFSSLPENTDNLAAHLQELGAPLSGRAKKSRSFSPEAVVLGVLRVVPSARMVECLPGLLATSAMDHEKLFRLAKERNLLKILLSRSRHDSLRKNGFEGMFQG